MLDGLIYRDLLLVNFDKLSFSKLLDLVRHLGLTHFWEVNADFLIDSFKALKVALGHLVAGCC
jgi:hypothetical protein